MSETAKPPAPAANDGPFARAGSLLFISGQPTQALAETAFEVEP